MPSQLRMAAADFLFRSAHKRNSSGGNQRIVIDAMNTYGIPAEKLGGKLSSGLVAASLAGARVVKTFNQLPAALLAKEPAHDGGRRVMFVWSRDTGASATVVELVNRLGFAAITLGGTTDEGKRVALGGPLILQNLIKLA